jgi:4-hydroxy-3-polyprenylbenzoate decarboxylase
MAPKFPRRLIVGITGATGAVYGIRLLQTLKKTEVETHLVVSRWGARTLIHETPHTLAQVKALATRSYPENDQGAALSSGSFLTMGMVIAPCSMKTLSAIAHGQDDDLVHRAADVVLKEKRRLVLVVRESPLNEIHLENMLKLARMGVVITPPVPAFYNHPRTIDDLVDHTVARILDLFGIHAGETDRWTGDMGVAARPRPAAVKKATLPRASRRSRRPPAR